MNISFLIILILAISSIAALINEKTIKLNETTGLTIFSMLFSFILTVLFKIGIESNYFTLLYSTVQTIPFKEIVLNYFVGFLLFAATLHFNVLDLKYIARKITYLATFGVIISAIITACLIYYTFGLMNLPLPFSACLIFGALISPTDPVAVIGVLKNNKNIPKNTQNTILAESLFNDATGILLLTIIVSIFVSSDGVLLAKVNSLSTKEISHMFINEVVFSILLALGFGILIGKFIIQNTKNHSTALLLTLFSSMTVYTICNYFHFSAPLAMVVLGLTMGYFLRKSKIDNKKIEDFWVFVDDILNSFLFVLIGLKILTIEINLYWLILGVLVIIFVMISRYISVIIPQFIFMKKNKESLNNINKKSLLMTLGGVRGGISLALALSINGLPDEFIYITYTVVVLSIIVQSYIFELYSKKTNIKWE